MFKSIRSNQKAINILLILLLAVSAILLRSFNLNKDFTGDETLTIEIADSQLSVLISNLLSREVYPPLTYFALHAWRSVSNSFFWTRLYFVIFGLGSCFLIFILARDFIDVKFARIALAISAFSPLLIFSSQYIRSYGDSAFWLLLSTYSFLRIMKNGKKAFFWFSYVAAATLAIYTFYFSCFTIAAHMLLVVLNYTKNKKMLFKWTCAFLAIFSLFSFWISPALKQFQNISSTAYNMKNVGFTIGSLKIGLLVRNFASLLGFDPYFMELKGGVLNHFSKPVLLFFCIISVFIFLELLRNSFLYLKKHFNEKRDFLFFPFIVSLGSLLLAWLGAIAFNIYPNVRYLVAPHAIFILLITACIQRIKSKSEILGLALLILILAVFLLRIPEATSSDFQSKKAYVYLKENSISGDCVISVKGNPDLKSGVPAFRIIDLIELNKNKTLFVSRDLSSWNKLKKQILPFKRIWFYKIYGNMEIFGGNDILEEWLRGCGYSKTNTKEFKNIDIVLYEKKK